MTVRAIYAGGIYYTVTGVGYNPVGSILQDDRPVELSQSPTLQECLASGLLTVGGVIELLGFVWLGMHY